MSHLPRSTHLDGHAHLGCQPAGQHGFAKGGGLVGLVLLVPEEEGMLLLAQPDECSYGGVLDQLQKAGGPQGCSC